jgi:hypothetical protein
VRDDVIVWSQVSPATTSSTDIRIRNCDLGGANGPGRNCISIIQGQRITIIDNKLANADQGTWNGVDCESNPGDTNGVNSEIHVIRNTITGCHVAVMVNSRAAPTNIVIAGNFISFCTYGIDQWTQGTIVRGNVLHDIKGFGIGSFQGNPDLMSAPASAVIDGNTVCVCGGDGIFMDGPNHVARNNTLTGTGGIQVGQAINADWNCGSNVIR